MISKFVVLLVVLSILFAQCAQMERERVSNKFWDKSNVLFSKTKKIQLSFAIKQQNIELLNTKLLEVSSPTSPTYGKLMTLQEINALTAPNPSYLNQVISFLKNYGVTNYDYSSGFLRTTVTVADAEAILGTKYSMFVHKTGRTAIRCSEYTLPDEISSIVDFVSPTVNFPALGFQPKPEDFSLRAPDASQNTPNSLRTLYGVDSVQGSGKHNARQATTAFLDQYYEEKDLQQFYKTYYTPLVGVPISNVVGPNGKKGGIEAALDVEYMSTLGSGVPTEFWSFAGSQPDNVENEPFLDWLYFLGNTTDTPYVFSTSYGEDEVSVSLDYATRMNEEFQEQALRGISFLFASGDSGVGSAFGPCTTYTPQYPSDSPYVTAVGATTGLSPETGAGLSSGGFSNRWAQPAWQRTAVANYLSTAKSLPAANLFNTSGRAFPDVSAQGTNYVVLNNGVTMPSVAGTSCSSPVFGGIVALLNDARISAGKSPMGFLNPFIYQHGSLFTDVLSGNNPGCGTTGFSASAGWDPVTGWGTPNYKKLVEAALSLP